MSVKPADKSNSEFADPEEWPLELQTLLKLFEIHETLRRIETVLDNRLMPLPPRETRG